jgi:hypothetical protein
MWWSARTGWEEPRRRRRRSEGEMVVVDDGTWEPARDG